MIRRDRTAYADMANYAAIRAHAGLDVSRRWRVL